MLGKEIIKLTMFSMYPLKWNPTYELVILLPVSYVFLQDSHKQGLGLGKVFNCVAGWIPGKSNHFSSCAGPTIMVVLADDRWGKYSDPLRPKLSSVQGLSMVFSNYDEGREPGIIHTENVLPFMLWTGKDSILIKQRVASEKLFSDRIFEAKAEFSPVK